MDTSSFFSRQNSTNILLAALVILNLVVLVVLTSALGKIQRSLNNIESFSYDIESNTGLTAEYVKYL